MTSPPSPMLPLIRPEIRAISAYQAEASSPETPVVKLDANESPWPLPAPARERIASAVAALPLHRYPDPRASGLRAALAERLGSRPDELILGSGSDEVISLLMTALVHPRAGRTRASVVVPTPTFVMYRMGALCHGLSPIEVELGQRFELDTDAMEAALSAHRPNLVFLASPNNPTGNVLDREALRSLIVKDPEALFVIDEAYAPFWGETLTGWCETLPNVAVMGTLSKIGLAAARVGWVRFSAELAREVDKARQPYNLSSLSQTVAELALGELWDILQGHVDAIRNERSRLGGALATQPRLFAYPSDANFILLRFDGDAGALARALAQRGVLVRSFHSHRGRLRGHLRVTVGTPEENDALIAALPEAIASAEAG